MSRQIRGIMIELRRSLLILNSKMMPVNLGRAGFEDQPEAGLPIAPYYARNVLPTQHGYKSAFAPAPMSSYSSQVAEQGIKYTQIQDVLVYQTRSGDRVSLGLTATGLWAWVARQFPVSGVVDTNDLIDWTLLSGTPYNSNEYFLWTNCTIDNILYIYCQGLDRVYMVGSLTDILNEEAAGANVLYSDEKAFFAIAERTPGFINMEGQIGIFKAANRLGFWDSDNAVAWSSAVDKMDFTPDATTFAGITTFTDVVGEIVMIKSHGKGFVIYCTGSIVHCRELSGSPEKFSGAAILTNTGVAYSTQVAQADPDALHYAWTPAGLLVINNGSPSWIEPEVSQYLLEDWQLVRLQVIQQTNLVISVAQTYTDAPTQLFARVISDGTGKVGIFNFREETFTYQWYDWLTDLISGALRDRQDQFPDFENTDQAPMPGLGSDRAIVPCFSGAGFAPLSRYPGIETLAWSNFVPVDLGSIPTWKFADLVLVFNPATAATALSANTAEYDYEFGTQFPGLAGTAFDDLAGNEFVAKMQETFDRLSTVNGAFASLMDNDTFLGPSSYVYLEKTGTPAIFGGTLIGDSSTCYPNPEPTIPQGGAEDVADDETITWYPELELTFQNILVETAVVMQDNNCVMQLIGTVKDYQMRFGVKSQSENTVPCSTGPVPNGYKINTDTPGSFLTIATRKAVPDSEKQVVLFEARITGWGYINNLGNFIKTQRRRASNACIPGDTRQFALDEPDLGLIDFNDEVVNPLWDPNWAGFERTPTENPDNQRSFTLQYYSGGIGYPSSQPIYATFRRGIAAPYYPIYNKAFILNTKLNKWGTYDVNHSLIFNAAPTNKADKIVYDQFETKLIPDFYAGAVPNYAFSQSVPFNNFDDWSSFEPLTNVPCYLTERHHYSMIRYGKIGLARAGATKLTGMSINSGARFSEADNAFTNITINASIDNATNAYDDGTYGSGQLPELDDGNAILSTSFEINGSQEVPFIMVGRWFTVDIKGSFDLSNLVFYGKREGNFRFTPPAQGC